MCLVAAYTEAVAGVTVSDRGTLRGLTQFQFLGSPWTASC